MRINDMIEPHLLSALQSPMHSPPLRFIDSTTHALGVPTGNRELGISTEIMKFVETELRGSCLIESGIGEDTRGLFACLR